MSLDKDQLNAIKPGVFDQYRYYPSKFKESWKDLFHIKIDSLSNNDEWRFYFDSNGTYENVVGGRISSWDYNHFGIKMGSISIICNGNSDDSKDSIRLLIKKCINDFREKGIQFVSTRICGDNLTAIHIAEEVGFKYYETIIWPVKNIENVNCDKKIDVRLMNKNDLDRVTEIASSNTFQRSHFHCDNKFPKDKVDSMHVKWIRTSWEKGDFISIIEDNNQVVGFFAFGIDNELTKILGYKYGRMKNLALDKNFRGKGLGEKLFSETIVLMKSMGVDIIDSGYAVKNLQSARLHVINSFIPVYEEVTFHLWL